MTIAKIRLHSILNTKIVIKKYRFAHLDYGEEANNEKTLMVLFFPSWNKVIKAGKQATFKNLQIPLYLDFCKLKKKLKTSFQALKIFKKLFNRVSCSFCLGFKRC